MTGSGTPTEVLGTFYFNNVDELNQGNADGTKANSGSVVDDLVNITEWGNNWMYGNFSDANGDDLRAEWGFLAVLEGSRFSAADFDALSDWDKANADPSTGGTRLGIDLRASGNGNGGGGAIPEPTTFVVWSLLGLIGTCWWRRKTGE